MFTGTSTGSLIAFGLLAGKQGSPLDVKEVIDLYEKATAKIFPSGLNAQRMIFGVLFLLIPIPALIEISTDDKIDTYMQMIYTFCCWFTSWCIFGIIATLLNRGYGPLSKVAKNFPYSTDGLKNALHETIVNDETMGFGDKKLNEINKETGK